MTWSRDNLIYFSLQQALYNVISWLSLDVLRDHPYQQRIELFNVPRESYIPSEYRTQTAACQADRIRMTVAMDSCGKLAHKTGTVGAPEKETQSI